MASQEIGIISQVQIKIEPKWEDEINVKQVEGQHLKIEEKLDVTKDSYTVQYTDIERKLFSDCSFKIEEQEVHIKDESEQFLEEVDKNIKQLEGKSLKIEEKLDVTRDSCTVQYTDIETKLFSDNSFKTEEEEMQIKDETEQCLEVVDKNTKNFEDGGCQRFNNDQEKYKCNIGKHTFSQEACICSIHFDPNCFEDISVRQQLSKYTDKNIRNLKDDAIPTLYLPLNRNYPTDSYRAAQSIVSTEQNHILELQEKVSALEKENNVLVNENIKLKTELTQIKNGMKQFLSPGQITRIGQSKYKSQQRWSPNDIASAISLRSVSPKAYLFLKKKGYPLPALSTLRKWASTLSTKPGILNDAT